jgi:hypothetical protein
MSAEAVLKRIEEVEEKILLSNNLVYISQWEAELIELQDEFSNWVDLDFEAQINAAYYGSETFAITPHP